MSASTVVLMFREPFVVVRIPGDDLSGSYREIESRQRSSTSRDTFHGAWDVHGLKMGEKQVGLIELDLD